MKTDQVRYEHLTYQRALEIGVAIVALGADNAWENWTVENLLAERLEKWSLSLLATVEGKPAGYAIASRKGQIVHLHHMIVGTTWRGMGIGSELLDRLFKTAQQVDALRLTLKVHLHNKRAIAFYQRFGFAGNKQDKIFLWMSADVPGHAG